MFKRIPYIGSIIPILIGYSVILGYVIQNQTLKSFFAGTVMMNPLTAMSFILGGLSLFIINQEKASKILFRIGLMCAILVTLIGSIKFGGILSNRDVYMDNYFFTEQLEVEASLTGRPNRMAPNTAIGFLLMGISLLLLYKGRDEWFAQILSLATFLIALAAILGYLYGIKNLTGFTDYIPMAINTAVALLMLSLGAFFSRGSRGFVSIISSDNLGGIVMRRLIPIAVLAPALFGYMGLMAERENIFVNGLGLSLTIVASITVFVISIWWVAGILNEIDKERDVAMAQLGVSHKICEENVLQRTADLVKKNKELEEANNATLNVLDELKLQKDKIAEDRAKNEAILESIGEGLIFVGSDLRITFVNRAIELLTGWSKQEIVGKIWTEFISLMSIDNKLTESNKRQLSMALDTKSTIVINAHTYIRKNKTKFLASVTASPATINNGVIGTILIFRDITREEEIDKEKTEFVLLASHQLRTPLSIVSWYTEMLLAGDVGPLNDEQRKYLDEVHLGNQRMAILVNSLLDISRLELGTFAIEPKEIDILKVAEDEISEHQLKIGEKKIKFLFEHDKDVPSIQADPKIFQMIIQNLLSNAIKYTPDEGSIKLGLHILKTGEVVDKYKLEKDNVVIIVSDTGYGIPESQQNKTFTKLFRADNVRDKDTKGTGLGLYVVKYIIDNSGGKVWFESKENKGTTFYVTLPVEELGKRHG